MRREYQIKQLSREEKMKLIKAASEMTNKMTESH